MAVNHELKVKIIYYYQHIYWIMAKIGKRLLRILKVKKK